MFGDMLNETLTLKKATTGHLHNFRASVQPSRSSIFTDDEQLPIEDGDTIERPRRNCVEFYTVVDAGYHEAIHGIPAHFQMKVRKVTRPAEPVAPKQVGTPASATAREDSRRTRLRQLLDDLDKLRLCGPSDDPDEQTSVIESYRYLLINVKAISKGLMPTDVMVQLGEVPSNIETIYDVYESKAHLDAVTLDLRTELEFPTTSDGPAGTTSFVSPSLIEDMRKANNQSFDVTKLTGYCTELNSSFHHGNVVASLLLMRTVMNHVPPIFGYQTFTEFTANSGKSLRENLDHLEKGLRKLADLYAHQPIRKKEQYPTKSQVEPFKGHFELLLQEVLTKLQ